MGGKRVRNNPALGTVTCATCGQLATVHQQARGKGRFLYTRGCECKFNSSTGKTFQQWLWDHTTWSEGAQPVKPSNVDDGTPADYDPNPAPEPAPAAAPGNQPAPAAGATSPPPADDPPAGGGGDSGSGSGKTAAKVLAALAALGALVVAIIAR